MRIGFAGAGNMAAALARGWAAGEDGPELMTFTDAGSGRAAQLAADLGAEEATSLPELAAASDVVMLATKPAALESAAPELSAAPLVVSMLGATPLERLREFFDQPVLRVMPNVGVEVRRGVICHAPAGPDAGEAGERALELLGLLGSVVELPEDQLDAATAVMGCSPAYIARVAAVLEREGVAEGLDPELTRALIAESIAGTGMLLATHSPEDVWTAVASPGGSTEAGLDALDEHDADGALAAAVAASLERMRP